MSQRSQVSRIGLWGSSLNVFVIVLVILLVRLCLLTTLMSQGSKVSRIRVVSLGRIGAWRQLRILGPDGFRCLDLGMNLVTTTLSRRPLFAPYICQYFCFWDKQYHFPRKRGSEEIVCFEQGNQTSFCVGEILHNLVSMHCSLKSRRCWTVKRRSPVDRLCLNARPDYLWRPLGCQRCSSSLQTTWLRSTQGDFCHFTVRSVS